MGGGWDRGKDRYTAIGEFYPMAGIAMLFVEFIS